MSLPQVELEGPPPPSSSSPEKACSRVSWSEYPVMDSPTMDSPVGSVDAVRRDMMIITRRIVPAMRRR
jgi:hypothetical protein